VRNGYNDAGEERRPFEGVMTPQLSVLVEQVAAYLKQEGATEVYLFGSAAMGTMHERSDIDLAVSGLEPAKFYRVAGKAEDMLGKPLDLVDLDEKTPFIRALKGNGELKLVA
jgi:predicted nucleotidyltransferase